MDFKRAIKYASFIGKQNRGILFRFGKYFWYVLDREVDGIIKPCWQKGGRGVLFTTLEDLIMNRMNGYVLAVALPMNSFSTFTNGP